jgi:hypothetical protein
MSELSLVERARLGQVDAIAALMNSSLHRLGIQARAAWQDNRLYVLLESAQPPDQRPCIEFIRQGLAQLQRIQAESAVVYGRGLGQTVPSWVQQIELTSPQPLTSPGKQVPDQVRGVPGIQPFAVDSLVVNPSQTEGPEPSAIDQDASLQMATIQIPEWLDSPDTELVEIPESPQTHSTPTQQSQPAVSQPRGSQPGASQLVHRPRAVRRPVPAHRWYLTALHKVLANDRMFVAVLISFPMFLVLLGGYALNRMGVGTVTQPAAPTAAPARAQIAVPTQPDAFEAALQQASVAVELGHAGKTSEDWQKVAQEWQGAIAQMQTVPKTHPNAAIAQIKLEEYQETLRQITAEHLSPTP